MYNKQSHIHFVGIGGIGMSGIATVLRHQGYRVSGCDADFDQASIEKLRVAGCLLYQGNNTESCHDTGIDVVVYSSAVSPDHPELIAARQRGIPTITRAAMLAELMRMKYSIAIAGSHGKTTTTSMISHVLIEAQRDPTVIIGGHVKNISHNARLGLGDFLVAEADESDRSLVRLYPTLAVVTNIDYEHVDAYASLADVQATFKQFLRNIPFYGKAFVWGGDPNIQAILPIDEIKVVRYGTNAAYDIYAQDIVEGAAYATCTVWRAGDRVPLGSLYISMPGKHNILNALAATAVALDLGISPTTIFSALATFGGVDRRFTFKGAWRGVELFDDYGHHPTEIACTLSVARRRAQQRLVVAFQPHRYTRMAGLWNDFIEVFKQSSIDHLIITDIYPASEKPIADITSERFVRELAAAAPHLKISYIAADAQWHGVTDAVTEVTQPGDLLLFLGAGKVNKVAQKLV